MNRESITVTREQLRKAGGVVFAVVAIVVLYLAVHGVERNAKAIGGLGQRVAFAECERVQNVRDASNQVASVAWLTLRSTEKRERALARTTVGGHSVHIANAKAARRLSVRLRYQPPVNCKLATRAPSLYAPPPSLPFEAAPLRLRT